jgi:hypothetical protein
VLGEFLDEIVLVHGEGSFARFAVGSPTLWPDGAGSNRKTQGFGGKTKKKTPDGLPPGVFVSH